VHRVVPRKQAGIVLIILFALCACLARAFFDGSHHSLSSVSISLTHSSLAPFFLFNSLASFSLTCLTFLARFLRCHHWHIQQSSRTFHSPCMCSAMAGANVLPHAGDISGRGYDRLRASRGETKRCARATRKRSEPFIFILSLFFSPVKFDN